MNHKIEHQGEFRHNYSTKRKCLHKLNVSYLFKQVVEAAETTTIHLAKEKLNVCDKVG